MIDEQVMGRAILAKIISKESDVKCFSLDPGRYEVDTEITLRVTGQVLKSEDTEYTPTADIPLIPTMALLLQRAGFTREGSEALILECASEAIDAGKSVSSEMNDRIKDVKETLAGLQARLSTYLPKKTRNGAMRVTGKIEIQSQVATVKIK